MHGFTTWKEGLLYSKGEEWLRVEGRGRRYAGSWFSHRASFATVEGMQARKDGKGDCRTCVQAFWERGAAEEERELEQGEGRRKRGYKEIGLDIDGQIHSFPVSNSLARMETLLQVVGNA